MNEVEVYRGETGVVVDGYHDVTMQPIDVKGMEAAMNAMREFVKGQLIEKIHYGKMPGVKKDFLLLPGAEQISRAFQCRPKYITVRQIIDPSTGYVLIWRKCQLVHISSGQVVGEADALCSSDERKFSLRDGGKQPFGQVLPNVLMTADKRAYVKAARTLGCTSEFFTQDSDLISGGEHEEDTPPAPPKPREKYAWEDDLRESMKTMGITADLLANAPGFEGLPSPKNIEAWLNKTGKQIGDLVMEAVLASAQTTESTDATSEAQSPAPEAVSNVGVQTSLED